MLTYFLIAVLTLAVLWGLYALWSRGVNADIAEGAQAEWRRFQRQDPQLLAGMTEDQFARIYARVERPRFPAYMLGAITAFAIGTPALLAVMNAGAYFADRAGMIAQPAEAASYLRFDESGAATLAGRVSPEALQYVLQGWAGFYYFFGLLFFWVLVIFVAMRRYHARTPGFLREEVLRSR